MSNDNQELIIGMLEEHYRRIKKSIPHAPEEIVRKLAHEAVENKVEMPLLDTSARTAEELYAFLVYEGEHENT